MSQLLDSEDDIRTIFDLKPSSREKEQMRWLAAPASILNSSAVVAAASAGISFSQYSGDDNRSFIDIFSNNIVSAPSLIIIAILSFATYIYIRSYIERELRSNSLRLTTKKLRQTWFNDADNSMGLRTREWDVTDIAFIKVTDKKLTFTMRNGNTASISVDNGKRWKEHLINLRHQVSSLKNIDIV